MSKQTKRFIIGVIVVLLLVVLAGGYSWFVTQQSKQGDTASSDPITTAKPDAERYILAGYPIEVVPLYKMTDVSASKFFVNHDPKSTAGYFGQPVNYYNVVFKTSASPDQTFAYYRSLLTSQNTQNVPEDEMQGQIGKYKISVAQYEDNPDTVYLRVYLPTEEYQQANRYYTQYPDLGLVDETWANYESSYGLLNQKGGQIEYTQYFALPLNSDVLIDAFRANKQSMPDYNFVEETGILQWQEEANKVTLTFSKRHQRIYLMIRRPLDS